MTTERTLEKYLDYLKLYAVKEHYQDAAKRAMKKKLSYSDYLHGLIETESFAKQQRALEYRIRKARFPYLKTLDQFVWSWPKQIPQEHIKELFRLQFIPSKENVIFLGAVGVGKTHLALALAHQACSEGYSVAWTSVIDLVNTLIAAKRAGTLKKELKRCATPELLVLDELGYLPIDKQGADLLFQIIATRYETGSLIITSNRAYKDWVGIFNGDATVTSAILDRVLHHSHSVTIEGKSYRMAKRNK